MALVNCTINSSQVTVAKGSQIGGSVANQVLTIIPNTGFVVRASDFTAGSPPAGISSIALADSGTPYAANNTITVTCDLTDTGSYNTSTNFTIDIDGSAILENSKPKTLSGTYVATSTANHSSIAGNNQNGTTGAGNGSFSVSGSQGEEFDLMRRTFQADSSYYFPNDPTLVITGGDVSDFVITKEKTLNSDGYLTSMVFDINGVIPLEDSTANVITMNGDVVLIPVVTNNISGYGMNTADRIYGASSSQMLVYGDVGATYKINVTRTGDTHTYNWTTEDFTSSATDSGTKTIGAFGLDAFIFKFPLVTADVTYTFTISPVSPTTSTISNHYHPFTIKRVGYKTLTVDAVSADRSSFTTEVIAYTDNSSNNINQTAGSPRNPTYAFPGYEFDADGTNSKFNFSIVIDDDQAFVFKAPNASANTITLSNSNWTSAPTFANGGSDVGAGTLTATRAADSGGNANQLLTITGSNWYNYVMGSANSVISINVDSFCEDGVNPNIAPVANTVSVSATKGGGVLVTLNATDADSDSLTYTVVSVPTNASLFTDAGQGTAVSAGTVLSAATVYYKHNNSNNFTDSFTYKANDGTIDSNTATVNAAIGVSPGASISTSGAAGVYLVPLVLGTGAGTFKAHFNAQGVPDRFEILFANLDNANGNTLANMNVQADSLFVGDNISGSAPARQQHGPSGMDLFTYNGSSFDTTSEDSQTVNITNDDVASNATGNRSDSSPNGASFGSGSQSGVQNLVFMSASDSTGTSNLAHSDGNICLTFTKGATTNTYLAYLRITGVGGTAWDLFKTEFA